MRLLAPLLAFLFVAGCLAATRLDDPDAGRTTRYEPGVPAFDAEAVGRPRGGATGIDLYLGVTPASLVYVQDAGGRFESTIDVLVRLFDRRGRELVGEVALEDTFRADAFAATRAYEPHHLVRRLDAPPGAYVVEVTLTDRASEASAVRRLRAHVAPAAPEGLHLSALRLEGRRADAPVAPVVALHVPAGLDTLRAVAAVTSGEAVPVEVRMSLVRFESDTSAAVAPYRFGVADGALVRRGVAFSEVDTLQRTRRRLEAGGTVELLFALPELAPGVYRAAVEAEAGAPGAAGEVLRAERTFSVTEPGWPRVATLPTMIDALSYLATRDEYAHLAAAGTPAERRRRFDAFWGGLVPDRARAADLLERYYSRVEEANRLFTSYKAGWKTDRGMVYIVFGTPLHVDRRPSGEVWHYGYGSDAEDGPDAFVFERLPVPEGGEGFANYALERGPVYDRLWLRALERWRSGRAL